jgi:hypothetical protein
MSGPFARFAAGLFALAVTAQAQTPAPPPAAPPAQAPPSRSELVVAAIRKHFEKLTPEYARYGRPTVYGETSSANTLTRQQLERERGLMQEAVAAGLLKSPPIELLNLGHDLIVHDPLTGLAYLKALHASAPLGSKEVETAFFVHTVAAGEEGEKLAVAELGSEKQDHPLFWARYLQSFALHESSIEPILARIAAKPPPEVATALLLALLQIGSPKALAGVQSQVEHATDDDVQGAAIFTCVELLGFDGIAYVEKIKPVGPKSTAEWKRSLEWLKKETSPSSKHARVIKNDASFVDRFADLATSPVIRWLNHQGLLEAAAVATPPLLKPEQKSELLELLIDSRGFGLEAVKGTLARALTKEDEPQLLKIRAASFDSPSPLSNGRAKTIGLMVRTLREAR